MHTHTHTHTHLIADQHVVREHSYQCKAASVTASEMEPWVWHIEYSGLMTQTWLNVLRAQEVEVTKDARVLLIKMDKVYMITSFAPTMHCGHERINKAPGVMVVREDQYDKWSIYASKITFLNFKNIVVCISTQGSAGFRLSITLQLLHLVNILIAISVVWM